MVEHLSALEILEGLPVAYFSLDREWGFSYLNPMAEVLLDREKEELLGNCVWEEFPEAVGSSFYNHYHRVMEERDPVQFQEYYRPLQTWFWVTAFPTPTGIGVAFIDTTRLMKGFEQRELLFELTTDLVACFDPRSGMLTRVNSALEKLIGYSEDELRSAPVSRWMHAEDIDRTAEEIDQILRGEPRPPFRNRFITASGEIRWIEWTTSLSPKTGEFLTIGRDITETVETVDALAEAKRLAEDANQAKSDFLALVSHELRTPLNAIIGGAEILNNMDLPEEGREIARLVRDGGTQLIGLINEILDFAQIERRQIAFHPEVADLSEVAEATCRLMRVQVSDKPVRLNLSLPCCRSPRVVTDVSRLRQILINLLSNAIKFTDEGDITLRLRYEQASSDAELAAPLSSAPEGFRARCKTRVVFEVADTGIGISECEQRKIFEPFYQVDASTSRRHEGTGLGLAISYQLARQMQGDITLTSRLGHGSAFKLVFDALSVESLKPAMDARTHQNGQSGPHAGTGDATADASRALDIWLVDDAGVSLIVFAQIIRSMGHRVRTFDSARSCLEGLKEEHPDALFLDLRMPEMDGFSLLREIVENCASHHKPMPWSCALTADVTNDTRRRCQDAGFDKVLYKPVKRDDLVKAINELPVQAESN